MPIDYQMEAKLLAQASLSQMIGQGMMTPIIKDLNKKEYPKVPGAQGIGLNPGSRCDICPQDNAKLSVSICNYKMDNFAGCNKSFCNKHGLGHFTSAMIDPLYFKDERINGLCMPKDDLALFKQLQIDRTQLDNDLKFIRYCRDCEYAYT